MPVFLTTVTALTSSTMISFYKPMGKGLFCQKSNRLAWIRFILPTGWGPVQLYCRCKASVYFWKILCLLSSHSFYDNFMTFNGEDQVTIVAGSPCLGLLSLLLLLRRWQKYIIFVNAGYCVWQRIWPSVSKLPCFSSIELLVTKT